VGSNTDNIAFHRSFAVSGGLALLRAFSQWKDEHQLKYRFFSFSFIFVTTFIKKACTSLTPRCTILSCC